eukprot:364397-Chlamydomonas_euryale.AAC.8
MWVSGPRLKLLVANRDPFARPCVRLAVVPCFAGPQRGREALNEWGHGLRAGRQQLRSACWICASECLPTMEKDVSLMLENGDTRDDLSLPTGTDDADKLAAELKVDFDEGKEILVTVTKRWMNGTCWTISPAHRGNPVWLHGHCDMKPGGLP